MVHLTETCDDDMPRLVVHADTTPANVHETQRTASIHDALAAKDLAPSEHLVDSAYVSADHLVTARTRHAINLIGPGRRNLSWQSRSGGQAFTLDDFTVAWDREVAAVPRARRVSAGQAAPSIEGRATSSTCGSIPLTAGPVPRVPAAPGRARNTRAMSWW